MFYYPVHNDNADTTPFDIFSLRRGTGRVFPGSISLQQPGHRPQYLFPPTALFAADPPVLRFINFHDPEQALIFTSGACLKSRKIYGEAAWGFKYKPSGAAVADGPVVGRLECIGPFGDHLKQTTDRAALRAVLAALRFQFWNLEGFSSLVIATDSPRVAQGATELLPGWVYNKWLDVDGQKVKDRDLWEALLGEFERWDSLGVRVFIGYYVGPEVDNLQWLIHQAAHTLEDVVQHVDCPYWGS
ncbi:hypothetical protein HIM_09432 [Hirsutella minnesotensis 3608]|uniref:RNase H type-1 domain-containing protein n=1 Tax=Hirsutella minnesotensis 3608 TaxID=1043627 RepID=A0A0F7ZXR4_9HYPO|nr:hypothetical protein HIM_09432 [Hirsutella minnesotensis 3608]